MKGKEMWVTRDGDGELGEKPYVRWWRAHPEYDDGQDMWLKDIALVARHREISEPTAVRLIGCKLSGGSRSIRRVNP